MILRRSRRLTIKMAEYETYSFGADVEMSHADLGITDAVLTKMTPKEHAALRQQLTEAVLAELDEQLVGEIQEAAELTEHNRSFILKATASAMPNAQAKPNAKPRREVRHA